MQKNIHKSNCDNTTSVANEYVVDKLVEVATLFGRRQEQGMCVSDNAVKTSKELDKYKVWYAEKANHLATANAEIERLKDENDDKMVFHSSFISALHKMLSGHGYDTEPALTRVENVLSSIKSRTAESNSYREQYNELRDAVYAGVSKPFSQSKARAEVLYEVKNIHHKVKHQEKIIELARESDARLHKWGHHWQRKYKRLVACVNKRQPSQARAILKLHRENEAKLKAKRGK